MKSRARSGIAKTQVACNNCGSDATEVIAVGRDHEYGTTTTDVFTVVRCRCGLVYLNPRPAPSELETIYPADYYAYQLVERRAKGNAADSLLARYMTARAARRLRPFLPLVRASSGSRVPRILDVGCGDGSTLDLWRRALGGEVETHGIEMDLRAAEIARSRGHRVVAKRIEDVDLPLRHFDFIYSLHVIEHVEDPSAFLRAMRAALLPGGHVLIDTPNVDTFDFRLFGARHWGGYHFPRHWTLYDAATFGRLARDTGFDVVRIHYCPSAIHWVWTLHSVASDVAPAWADRLFPPVDIFLRGSPWNIALLGMFTTLDLAGRTLTGRCSTMRILLRPEEASR